MTPVANLSVRQLNPGDTTVQVCWCVDSNNCADEYEIAWRFTPQATGVPSALTYVSVPLQSVTYPCDYLTVPADGDACDHSYTLNIGTSVQGFLEINMRKKNTANATAGACGPWIGWDGNPLTFANAATEGIQP